MILFPNVRTSKRVSLYFSIFSLISMIILMIATNIIYFVMWYNDQKKESLYDMNMNYSQYAKNMDQSNIESFKDYLLQKDVLIIPNNGEKALCSTSLEEKSHTDLSNLQEKFIYKFGEKYYVVYSQYYKEIGEVKVFFDTTNYVKSQILILQISLCIIICAVILNYFLWEYSVKCALENLEKIKKYSQNIDINAPFEPLKIHSCENDEIKIVADTLNATLSRIKLQNSHLEQFILDVGHELKTPLMEILSQLNLFEKIIEKKWFSPEMGKEMIEKNKKMVLKLNTIIETLFLITRLKEKNISLNLTQTNLKTHIQHRIWDKKSHHIHLSWEKTLPIEEASFDMIFENILGNSLKFSPENSDIFITLDDNFLKIQDHGKGIKKENLEKIFEQFFREDENYLGFGIGLFLVKRLCDLYGWSIQVESEEWKWTTTTIYFAQK